MWPTRRGWGVGWVGRLLGVGRLVVAGDLGVGGVGRRLGVGWVGLVICGGALRRGNLGHLRKLVVLRVGWVGRLLGIGWVGRLLGVGWVGRLLGVGWVGLRRLVVGADALVGRVDRSVALVLLRVDQDRVGSTSAALIWVFQAKRFKDVKGLPLVLERWRHVHFGIGLCAQVSRLCQVSGLCQLLAVRGLLLGGCALAGLQHSSVLCWRCLGRWDLLVSGRAIQSRPLCLSQLLICRLL